MYPWRISVSKGLIKTSIILSTFRSHSEGVHKPWLPDSFHCSTTTAACRQQQAPSITFAKCYKSVHLFCTRMASFSSGELSSRGRRLSRSRRESLRTSRRRERRQRPSHRTCSRARLCSSSWRSCRRPSQVPRRIRRSLSPSKIRQVYQILDKFTKYLIDLSNSW